MNEINRCNPKDDLTNRSMNNGQKSKMRKDVKENTNYKKKKKD